MTHYERHWKRVIDLACAGLAIIVLSPVFVLCGVAVRATSRGPAIFKQPRVGAAGDRFTLMKFRSMPVDSQAVASAEAASLRVTPVGRVLRRTNADELPQLLNILKGEMSLVGPRPALPSQHDLLSHRTEGGAGRLRPGLTGLAQVNSFDGMTARQKAEWDEMYAERITLRKDLAIIAATFRYLAKPPPRY